jgi:hypothetical protein
MPLVVAIPAFRGTDLADSLSFTAGTVYAAGGNDRVTLLGTGRAFGGSGNDSFFMGNLTGQQAFGGFGDDFFSVTGTGALQSAIKGGVGNDTVLFRGAMSATVETDEGIGLLRGVENILSYTGGLTLRVLADRTNITAFGTVANTINIAEQTADRVLITLAGGDDVVNVAGDSHRIDTGSGNDRVVASGADMTVATGSGNDTLSAVGIEPTSQFDMTSRFDTGGGNDVASLSGQGQLSMGRGNDTLTYTGAAATESSYLAADMGGGNDRVVSTYYGAQDGGVNLGAGADVMVFRGVVASGASVITGLGADTLMFEDMALDGSLRIDFNVLQDRLDLSFFGIDALTDVSTVTQVGADVVLFLADPSDPQAEGLTLTLSNTQLSLVTDAIFV